MVVNETVVVRIVVVFSSSALSKWISYHLFFPFPFGKKRNKNRNSLERLYIRTACCCHIVVNWKWYPSLFVVFSGVYKQIEHNYYFYVNLLSEGVIGCIFWGRFFQFDLELLGAASLGRNLCPIKCARARPTRIRIKNLTLCRLTKWLPANRCCLRNNETDGSCMMMRRGCSRR